MTKNRSEINEILDSVSQETRSAIYVLSVLSMLTDSIAKKILSLTTQTEDNALNIIREIKSFPIWRERTQNSWTLDDDVREYALIQLNGSAKQIQKSTLAYLKEIKELVSEGFILRDKKDLEYQIARLAGCRRDNFFCT